PCPTASRPAGSARRPWPGSSPSRGSRPGPRADPAAAAPAAAGRGRPPPGGAAGGAPGARPAARGRRPPPGPAGAPGPPPRRPGAVRAAAGRKGGWGAGRAGGAELLDQQAERAVGVAEAAGRFLLGEALKEDGTEGLVLALPGASRLEEEALGEG